MEPDWDDTDDERDAANAADEAAEVAERANAVAALAPELAIGLRAAHRILMAVSRGTADVEAHEEWKLVESIVEKLEEAEGLWSSY
jgi:hypothetical protein